jgi:uncharacterized membrane protein
VGDHWDTGRTEAFSDGVFAIAITLLVLDITVSPGWMGNARHAILEAWPEYFGYVTSFLTIGGLWMIHHGIFRRMRSADHTVMRTNMLLLLLVAFLPFPTRLMAEAIHNTDAERTAVIFYGLTLASISIVIAFLWRTVMTHPDLIDPDVTPDERRAYTRLTQPNIGFYVVSMVIAYIDPQVAAGLYLVIALSSLIRAPGSTRQHGRGSPEHLPG